MDRFIQVCFPIAFRVTLCHSTWHFSPFKKYSYYIHFAWESFIPSQIYWHKSDFIRFYSPKVSKQSNNVNVTIKDHSMCSVSLKKTKKKQNIYKALQGCFHAGCETCVLSISSHDHGTNANKTSETRFQRVTFWKCDPDHHCVNWQYVFNVRASMTQPHFTHVYYIFSLILVHKKEDNKNTGRLSSSVCAADSTDLILWFCKPTLHELSVWLSSDDLVGEEA